jgi:hypothetical protein
MGDEVSAPELGVVVIGYVILWKVYIIGGVPCNSYS